MNQKTANPKTVVKTALILFLNVVLIAFFATSGAQNALALSKMGSRGAEVKQIQTKLKSMGYYKGNIDSIFGSQTKAAVVKFQKDNKLDPDGIVGKNTLKALGLSGTSGGNTNSSDLNLLARVISAEARGEPYNGQVAVGAVILNRVASASFPDTISGVCYQPGAFTCMTDGQINKPVADSAYKAAQDALNGMDPSGGAIYYFNPATAKSQWMWSRPVITTIGRHRFCR